MSTSWKTGTSGFMTSQKNWFEKTDLNCIEINSTFYRVPTERSINSWNKFPREVDIVVKVSRYITHIKRLLNFEEIWMPFWEAVKSLNNLSALLFQFPPTFNNTDINLDRLKAMKPFMPKGIKIVIEFRNISWFNDDIYKEIEKLGFCVASVLITKTDKTKSWLGTMPDGLTLVPAMNNCTYFRVHGGKGNRGFYTEEELKPIYKKLKSFKAEHNYALFNNTFFQDRTMRCSLDDSIRYAAICDAMLWETLTK